MKDIRESDWKHLRQLHPVALERFCSRILSEIESASTDRARTSHERYLSVFQLIQNRDHELGQMFDDPKRSTATSKIFLLRKRGLLTDDEWDGFSDEIKSTFAQFQAYQSSR